MVAYAAKVFIVTSLYDTYSHPQVVIRLDRMLLWYKALFLRLYVYTAALGLWRP